MFHPRLLICAFVMALMAASPARAVSLLRDADIEYGLQQLAAPVLQAVGLGNQVDILIVDDNALNAFVADSQHIFINYGLILKLQSAGALQAVIAHEAAHITNGHMARRAGNARNARTATGLGLILAAAAGVASGSAEAGAGLAFGTASSAQRLFLSHTRAEEASADQTAVRSMVRAGIDPKGAIEVFDIFRGQEALSVGRQDPYMLSHPLTRDRMRAMEGFVAAYGKSLPDDPTAAYWFARVQGKLSAFKRAPNWTLRRADESPSRDIALMRKAAAYHLQSNLKKALGAIDGALALRPRDPFLMELKGQILLESRQAGPAVQVYQNAVSLAPNNALILGGLGRSLLASGNPKSALQALERARSRDWRDARVLRDLATAYAQTGQNGMASAATAERYALMGRLKDAGIHAKRAVDLLPRGSAAWQRSQDVLIAAERAAKR